ncbi:MAG: sulfur carrier protein ThiS [Oscillospiraceae bacterium]|jgi:thiamine biosynthesis protein ThiS|nr:sulfur carrier protein ThiS [Oscillospiraceae bacterium]
MKVNGETVEDFGGNLLAFLEENGYRPQHVVCERNGEIITGEHFAETALAPTDDINILHFMGGG